MLGSQEGAQENYQEKVFSYLVEARPIREKIEWRPRDFEIAQPPLSFCTNWPTHIELWWFLPTFADFSQRYRRRGYFVLQRYWRPDKFKKCPFSSIFDASNGHFSYFFDLLFQDPTSKIQEPRPQFQAPKWANKRRTREGREKRPIFLYIPHLPIARTCGKYW